MAGTRPTDRKASTVPWHREASTGHSHQSGIGTVDASLLTLHDQRSDCHRRVGRSRIGLRDRSKLRNTRGVEVTLVELKDIQLPDSMKRAMARQGRGKRRWCSCPRRSRRGLQVPQLQRGHHGVGCVAERRGREGLPFSTDDLRTLLALGSDCYPSVAALGCSTSSGGEIGLVDCSTSISRSHAVCRVQAPTG